MEAVTIEDRLWFDDSCVFCIASRPESCSFITPGDINVLYQESSIETASLKAGWINKKFIKKSLSITQTHTQGTYLYRL